MRDRLIELLSVPIYPREGADPAEVVADYLLDNGIIVPPCKVGMKKSEAYWLLTELLDEADSKYSEALLLAMDLLQSEDLLTEAALRKEDEGK